MVLESLLAFFHISAFLGWIVFATSQAVLCRGDWMNPPTLERLQRLDRILWIAAAAVLASGLARIYWGAKGPGWYLVNPLLYTKIGLFAAVALLQLGPSLQYHRWLRHFRATRDLPPELDVQRARRHMMLATHLMAVIPLPAVFLARGFGA